jgi:hypothetical protein
MYGLPKTLDLSFLNNLEVEQVCIDRFNVLLQFYPTGSLNMQCGWALSDTTGKEVDRHIAHDEREFWRIHKLLGKKIHKSIIVSERQLNLEFESGYCLSIFDDSDQYETFNIQYKDLSIYV